MFDNYNTTTHKNNGTDQHNKNEKQHRKNTENNKEQIRLKGTVAELKYIGVHADGCDDWRSVLEFRNWTALRTLDLSNTAITQGIVKSTTLVLSSSPVCNGPNFNIYKLVHLI